MKNKYIILTKIKDKVFNGNHPNFVNIGSKLIRGYCKNLPVIGEQLFLYDYLKFNTIAWTSIVLNYDLKTKLLETKNSIYKIKIIKNEKQIKN